MTSRVSGSLVYWNAHTGFGEIDLDDGDGRIGVYRADLLRAGVRTPRVGDRFHFSVGVAASGITVVIDLRLESRKPTHGIEASRQSHSGS
jgi:cold shock CspA family protein